MSDGTPATSIAFVDLLDEAGELRGRAPHRPERLLVVHPHRPEQADRAERAVGNAVSGADEREALQVGMLELDADANERPARVERLAQDFEQRGALLEQLEHALVCLELVSARALQQPGGAADVEALALDEEL